MSLVPELILVGASTGGPKVLMEMVRNLKHDVPPIVWVNHIGTGGHIDVLINHINQSSNLKAEEAGHNMVPKRGTIYLSPSNSHLKLSYDGQVRLRLDESEPYLNCRPSVNLFFQSAAEFARRVKTLGFILTGMGDDGVEGCYEFKKNGGSIITQSQESCMIYGMPRAVDEAGLSQHSMSPIEIVNLINSPMNALKTILQNKNNQEKELEARIQVEKEKVRFEVDRLSSTRIPNKMLDSESRILDLFKKLVMDTTGNVTFEDRPELLKGKLRKFLHKEKCDNLNELYQKCKRDEILLRYIVGEMTIHESMFFRDKMPFQFFQEVILRDHNSKQRLDVWSACCALGQEPYSIAICVDEFIAEHHQKLDVNIAATDIDINCLQIAESGVYSKFQVMRGMPDHLRDRYFSFDNQTNKYIAEDTLKRKIFFSNFNLMERNYDKYSNKDVIFCRYSLIYFDQNFQQKVLDLLVKALKPRGYLILDPAMSLKVQRKDLESMSYNKTTIFRKMSA